MGQRIGPYEVVSELGRGGMGVVYRARHAELGREVALKVILPDQFGFGPSDDLAKRFRREARAAATLAGHPNVVGVHDAGVANDDDGGAGELYLAMELVQGCALEDLIEGGDRSFEQLASWIAQAADAVEHAHVHGILHRDLKPANILIDDAGNARVTDFGLARRTAADAHTMRLTRSDAIVGTPAYMAPEQALGDTVDERSDVYALGATLHAALTGAPPHGEGSMLELLTRVIQVDPLPPSAHNPAVPADLDAVVLRCLEKRPERRYPSALELAKDLRRFVAGERVLATRPGPVRRVARWSQAHPVAAVAGVVVLIAGGALTVGSWWAAGRSAADEQQRGSVHAEGDAIEAGRRVSQLYQSLSLASLAHLRRLEDHQAGQRLARPALADVLTALDTDVTAAAAQLGVPGDAAPVRAWVELGRFLAREDRLVLDVEALHRLSDTAGDDPFPCMLLARALLSYVAASAQHPALMVTDRGVEVSAYTETELQASARTRAVTAINRARASALWPNLTAGAEYVRFAEAVALMDAQDWESAATLLSELMQDRGLQATAGPLAVVAAVVAHDYRLAAETLEQLALRGWAEAWAQAAGAHMNHGVMEQLALRDPEPFWNRAEQCVAQALKLMPDRPEYWASRGVLFMERGRAGTDPDRQIELLEHAVREFTAAIDGGIENPLTWLNRANARARLGKRLWLSGRAGADEALAAAIADATTALRKSPRLTNALSVRAMAWTARGERWQATGEQPPATGFKAAVNDLTLLINSVPQPQARNYMNRGQVFVSVAAMVGEGTKEGADALRQSRDDLNKALQMEPENGATWRALGMTLRAIAISELRQRLDATDSIDGALAAFRKAAEQGSGSWETFMRLGGMHTVQARWQATRTIDPKDALRRGREELSKAIAAAPGEAEPYSERGLAWLAEANWLENTGGDPTECYQAGLADYDAAIARDPDRGTLRMRRGALLGSWGQRTERAGGDALELYERSAADYDLAVQQLRRNLEILQRAAFARVALVRLAVQRGGDPTAHARIGLQRANEAAGFTEQLPPRLSLVRIEFAFLLKRWDDAMVAVEHALKFAPNEPQFLKLKGEIEHARARAGD